MVLVVLFGVDWLSSIVDSQHKLGVLNKYYECRLICIDFSVNSFP